MKNLAAIVTKDAIIEALNEALFTKPRLRPATKFHLIYKGQAFPPKEVVRLAARKMGIRNVESYRLIGGDPTNRYLKELGFEIVPFAEWKHGRPDENETRIARLTFNTNNWERPSGYYGKSKSKQSYESTNGYGHEEWLFDFTKTIDGYKYGFLEPVNKHIDKYIGQSFDIYLFTVNSKTGERYWVGKINNAEIIDSRESERIKRIYQRNGWYKEMKQDMEVLGLDGSKIDKWDGASLFNVKFKKEDLIRYPPYTQIAKGDTSIGSYHYVLLHAHAAPEINTTSEGRFILGNHTPGRRSKNRTITRNYEQQSVEHPFIHHQISEALEAILKKNFDAVYAEHDTGFNTSIDLVAVKGKQLHFYEIKTYGDIRTCIRQAIGQLLEYSYYPDKKLAEVMYIVTPHEVKTRSMREYITTLQTKVGLPIKYMAFDVVKNRVVQII